MKDFTFYNPARIIFGKNSLDMLGDNMHHLGKRVLLHYGMASIKKHGIYEDVMNRLSALNIEVYELGGVKANPEFDLVAQGIKMCKEHAIEGILAVGGGSVIDSAKGIAAGVLYAGNIEEAYVDNLNIDDALPIGCVLTIPAAGSESSASSVVSVNDATLKRSIKGTCLIPRFAIINPAYFVSLRSDQAAAGISDIFAHLLERYFTNTEHVDYTDRLLEATMRTIIHYGPYVVNHLDDIDAWSEIGFAGTLAHNGLLGSGREEDWASHRIEHELTAMYHIPHGAGLAIVFPAWMKHVYPENKDRFVQFAQRVFDVDYATHEVDKIIEEGISRYERFLKSMFLPTRLHEAGILNDDSDIMIERMYYKRSESFGNFKKLYAEDVYKIFKYAK